MRRYNASSLFPPTDIGRPALIQGRPRAGGRARLPPADHPPPLDTPSTMNERVLEYLSRIGMSSLWAAELRHSCAFSRFSNASTTTRPLGGSPSKITIFPPRTRYLAPAS